MTSERRIIHSGETVEYTREWHFPANPVVGDAITADGRTYMWDGDAWMQVADTKNREKTMTTRHSGYQIILADDIRDEDAERLITALYMIKGVRKVVPIEASYEDVLARDRRDSLWRDKVRTLLDEMERG